LNYYTTAPSGGDGDEGEDRCLEVSAISDAARGADPSGVWPASETGSAGGFARVMRRASAEADIVRQWV
jgi:hypothetical protein